MVDWIKEYGPTENKYYKKEKEEHLNKNEILHLLLHLNTIHNLII